MLRSFKKWANRSQKSIPFWVWTATVSYWSWNNNKTGTCEVIIVKHLFHIMECRGYGVQRHSQQYFSYFFFNIETMLVKSVFHNRVCQSSETHIFLGPKIQMHVHTGTCVPVHFLIKVYLYNIFLFIVINRLIMQILFSGLKYKWYIHNAYTSW